MRKKTRRTTAFALSLMLAGAASAIAAGPLKGRTYEGGVPSTGITSEGHHQIRLHSAGNIVLHVASNGRSVSVRFTSPWPVLYCITQQALQRQTTKPASISHGSFNATISQRFAAGPGPSAIVQVIAGHFSGHTVRGTIHTRARDCGGTSTFSARAR